MLIMAPLFAVRSERKKTLQKNTKSTEKEREKIPHPRDSNKVSQFLFMEYIHILELFSKQLVNVSYKTEHMDRGSTFRIKNNL